jgi:hypothetical protein
MKHVTRALFAMGAFAALAVAPACNSNSFPSVVNMQRLNVTLVSTNNGSPESRLDISFTTPSVFTVDIEADDPNGNVDPSFNGFVQLSVVPGTVVSLAGPNEADIAGSSVLLHAGRAQGIQVSVVDTYGNANIWVEDLGYVPVDPARIPPPECANGKDDNLNGKIDYLVDPGCYAANDDTEDGGTYAAAVTGALYFAYPRIADVRGVNNGGVTPFNNQQLAINTEWTAPSPGQPPSGVVVTGVSSSGFYVTDLTDRRGYTSVYAYNYTAPPIMLPCDRLITFGGTAGDFYGYTEVNFPTWSLEEWDPMTRGCWVPDANRLTAGDLAGGATPALLDLEAALVAVSNVPLDTTTVTTEDGTTTTVLTHLVNALHIGSHFGPNFVPGSPSTDASAYKPGPDASDCDYNGDGKIEYLTNCGPESNQACPEDLCSAACTADPECSEYSAYATEYQFRLVVTSTTTTTTTVKNASGTMPPVVSPPVTSAPTSIEGVGSADANFNPVQLKGQPLGTFTGNLLYFSGGEQFTIQARCADDIVTNPKSVPLPTSCPLNDASCHAACVVQRNAADETNAN